MFRAAHSAVLQRVRRELQEEQPEASESDVAAEVSLRVSLLLMQERRSPEAGDEDAGSSGAPTFDSGSAQQPAAVDLKFGVVGFPVPPESNFWDYPLSRVEKKARILMIDQQVALLEQESLMHELVQLKFGGADAPACQGF